MSQREGAPWPPCRRLARSHKPGWQNGTQWSWLLVKPLDGKRFETDAEVQQGTILLLQTLGTKFFYAGTQSLLSRWGKILKCHWWLLGSLKCTICYTCAIFKRRNQIKVLGIRAFVNFYLETTAKHLGSGHPLLLTFWHRNLAFKF
jgi:hypothetical protein